MSTFDEAAEDLVATVNGRAPSYEERAEVEAQFADPQPDQAWIGADGQEYELEPDNQTAHAFEPDDHAAEWHDADEASRTTTPRVG